MLIECPECAHSVSDKAISCPNCGYPIKSTPTEKKAVTSRPRKFRRLPNGFGSIKHLSGNRRNPYAAYPPTKEWNERSPKSRPAIGYFPTYNEAYQALTEYNRIGIDIEKKLVTFSDVYDMFMDEYQKKDRSKGSLNEYRGAYKLCSDLHDKTFVELRKPDFQAVFDKYNDKYSVAGLTRFKKLFNQMYNVAIENDLVDKNYSKNVIVGGRDTQQGVPFTEEEILRIWNALDGKYWHYISLALIMIYSGYRIGELKVAEIQDDRFVGGLKTKNGKGRTVPIHSAIEKLVRDTDFAKRFEYETFYSALRSIGLEYAANGERHTPHDCRHTFSWLADKYGMDTISKHMIMGHSLGKDVEANVYGHRTFEQLKAEIEKIQSPKMP